MSNRIETANAEDFIKGKILDYAVDRKEQYTRIFYYGIVINNEDSLNANRIKVRIPFLDDNFYVGKSEEEGNKVLPWCHPFNRNFIETPETNTIVLVALMDPAVPYFGRIYLDAVTDLNKADLFDSTRLVPEEKTYNNWSNIESAMNIVLKSKPKTANEYNVKNNVKYPVGIRGKGKNRLTLDKDSITLIQNEKDNNIESLLKLTADVKLEASDKMELLSKKGGKKYHPVFDEPLYDYLSSMNNMIKSIVQLLNSTPSTNSISMQPDLPSPQAPNLIADLSNMYADFSKLKVPGNGASKQITIN